MVDVDGLSRDRVVEVWRACLSAIADAAETFETDLPFSRAEDWTVPVRDAAERLARHAQGRRNESDHYKRTGVVPSSDAEDWEAFVAFAPYAFDGTVWSQGGPLAELADEGQSLVVHLSQRERDDLRALDPSLRIVPLHEWRKR